MREDGRRFDINELWTSL